MPDQEHKTSNPFQLIAGHPALDLVNTLDNRFRETAPEELLPTYQDLLDFTVQSGLLTERQEKKLKRADASSTERAQVLTQVRQLREALATVAYAQPQLGGSVSFSTIRLSLPVAATLVPKA